MQKPHLNPGMETIYGAKRITSLACLGNYARNYPKSYFISSDAVSQQRLLYLSILPW